jgi:hypothetical protein
MRILLASASLLILVSAGPAAKPPQSAKITGDYVEARTASVFAGACHYNGELVTTGRDAVMAWSFTAGAYNGTDLAGVRAMAAVTSDQNLGQENAARKVELVVDTRATSAQASAVADLLRDKCGAKLGEIGSVRRAPVTFDHADRDYSVKAEGFASISVRPMPNNECCAQPNLVWYSPLTPLEHRKVGFTNTAAYTAGTVGDAWQRQAENSAIYGTFSF